MNNETLEKLRKNVNLKENKSDNTIYEEYFNLMDEMRSNNSGKLFLYILSMEGLLNSSGLNISFPSNRDSENEQSRGYINIETFEQILLPLEEAKEFEKNNNVIVANVERKKYIQLLEKVKTYLLNLTTPNFITYHSCPNDTLEYRINDLPKKLLQEYILSIYKDGEDVTVNKLYKKYNNKKIKIN